MKQYMRGFFVKYILDSLSILIENVDKKLINKHLQRSRF